MTDARWMDRTAADILPYSYDITALVARIGQSLVSCTATAEPSDLSVGPTSVTAEGLATVVLSGGSAGTDYRVAVRMVLQNGYELTRSVRIRTVVA